MLFLYLIPIVEANFQANRNESPSLAIWRLNPHYSRLSLIIGVRMGRKSHLCKEERLVIQVVIESGCSLSAITKELNRSKSCISKEIHLNTDPDCYLRAHNISRERQSLSKTRDYKINKMPKEIIDKLFTEYMGVHELSPDDAAYKLRKDKEYKVS